MDYVKLKEEIDKPIYTGLGDVAVAAMLNAVGDLELPRGNIPASEIIEVATGAELNGLSKDQKDVLQLIVSPGEVNVSADGIQEVLAGCFTGETAATYAGMKMKKVSKAMFLGLSKVRHKDVARTRRKMG